MLNFSTTTAIFIGSLLGITVYGFLFGRRQEALGRSGMAALPIFWAFSIINIFRDDTMPLGVKLSFSILLVLLPMLAYRLGRQLEHRSQ